MFEIKLYQWCEMFTNYLTVENKHHITTQGIFLLTTGRYITYVGSTEMTKSEVNSCPKSLCRAQKSFFTIALQRLPSVGDYESCIPSAQRPTQATILLQLSSMPILIQFGWATDSKTDWQNCYTKARFCMRLKLHLGQCCMPLDTRIFNTKQHSEIKQLH